VLQNHHSSHAGVYYLYRLIERHGRKDNVMKWKELLKATVRGATHTARTNVATWDFEPANDRWGNSVGMSETSPFIPQ
jgi:hypothetical protein